MDAETIRAFTSVEDGHWWYQERRAIIARELRRLGPPGKVIEIGASGGGNCRALPAGQVDAWRIADAAGP